MKEVPGGLQLGTLFGFPLFVPTAHVGLAPVVLFWGFVAGMQRGGEIEDGFIFLLIIMGSVLAHELGHAFAARAFGRQVWRVALTWYGGYAVFEQTSSRIREIAIAIAGPLTNLLLAGLAWASLLALQAATPIPIEYDGHADAFWNFHHAGLLERSLRALLFVNLGFCVFNLLPGLPLDGGHALRGALSTRLSRSRAHNIAMWCGVWIGLITVASAFALGNLWNIALGATIAWMAWATRLQVD